MLGRWLRDAGCGAQRERPLYSIWGIEERVIHQTAYAIEVSAGQPAHAGFVAQARRFAHQVKPFLLRTGVIEDMEHAALCDQLAGELASREFCGLCFPCGPGHRVRDPFRRLFHQAESLRTKRNRSVCMLCSASHLA